jgi:hypothetical protein
MGAMHVHSMQERFECKSVLKTKPNLIAINLYKSKSYGKHLRYAYHAYNILVINVGG